MFSLVCYIMFDHLGKLKPSKAFDPGVTLTLPYLEGINK